MVGRPAEMPGNLGGGSRGEGGTGSRQHRAPHVLGDVEAAAAENGHGEILAFAVVWGIQSLTRCVDGCPTDLRNADIWT